MKQFMITSHGWSASNWVAHSLNLHPDITCTHSARNIIPNRKDIHSSKELKKNIRKFHVGYASRQTNSFNDIFEIIKSYGDTNYYGTVHFYRLRDIPVVYENFGRSDHEIQIYNLIRNPIDLVWSGYGQFKDLFRYDLNELNWTLSKLLNEARDFVFDLADKYDLYIGDHENLAFLCSACILGSLRKDLDGLTFIQEKSPENIVYCGEVKKEDITTNPAYLSNLLSNLTNSKLDISPEYLEEVYNLGAINHHKEDTSKIEGLARYETFTDWQKETFLFFMDKYSLTEPYKSYGYQLPK